MHGCLINFFYQLTCSVGRSALRCQWPSALQILVVINRQVRTAAANCTYTIIHNRRSRQWLLSQALQHCASSFWRSVQFNSRLRIRPKVNVCFRSNVCSSVSLSQRGVACYSVLARMSGLRGEQLQTTCCSCELLTGRIIIFSVCHFCITVVN